MSIESFHFVGVKVRQQGVGKNCLPNVYIGYMSPLSCRLSLKAIIQGIEPNARTEYLRMFGSFLQIRFCAVELIQKIRLQSTSTRTSNFLSRRKQKGGFVEFKEL